MTEGKQPQQVVYVIRYFYPFIGGLEKKVFNLARALSGAGLKITIVTSRFSLSWKKKEYLHGVEIIRLPSPRIKIAGALLYSVSLFLYLCRNRQKFDLCHTFQVGYSSACAIVAGRLLDMKTVLTLSSSGSGGDVQRHRRSLWGKFFLRCCLKASSIITLHENMAREITALQPARSPRIIPNGVDTNRYSPSPDRGSLRRQLGIDPEDRLILYAGRLSPEKGVDFLLKSFSVLPPGKSVRLWLFGHGPERPSLVRLIDELGLQAVVRLNAATDSITAMLQAADLFIMPSQFEGMSNAVLEAMACGVPVIATDVAGNREIIAHDQTGLLVPFGDTAALSSAITRVLDDPGLAGQLSENARGKVAGQYNLANAVALHRHVYAGLAFGETDAEMTA